MKILREISLLYLLLVNVTTDSSNMFFVKTNETINLDDFMECDTWRKDNKDVLNTFAVLVGNIGYYYCVSRDTTIFIFTVDRDMTFEFMPVQQSFLVGDNVTLSCYVTFQSSTNVINSQARIHYSFTSNISNASDEVYDTKYEKDVKGDIQLDTNGTKTYFCTWSFSIKGKPYNGNAQKNVSLRVYMPPKDVRPDATNAQVNVTRIMCLSEADPPPLKYSWNCGIRSSWSSNATSIIFHEIGNYSCICSVENNINGKAYHSQWNGTISVMSKDDYDRFTTPSTPPYYSSSLAIALGTLAGLALVAVIVGLLLWKFKNGCRQALRKTDKNKVEAGKEPLETIENPVYGQL